MGHDRHGIFLCVPENRSRPIVVKEKKKKKLAIEKLKIKYKTNTKPGPIHKLKNVKRMNSLIDQTTDMTQKSTTRT